jgi:hypothetical protein
VVLELYRERKSVQNPDGKSFHLAPDKTKGYRFVTTESGPRVVDWDGNIEFDAEDTYYKIIDLKSDISGLKSYATEGKGINKKVAQEKEQLLQILKRILRNTFQRIIQIPIIILMIKMKKLTTTIPPLRGPNPQGLNINYNTVRTVKSEKITNGRNRQVATKRS